MANKKPTAGMNKAINKANKAAAGAGKGSVYRDPNSGKLKEYMSDANVSGKTKNVVKSAQAAEANAKEAARQAQLKEAKRISGLGGKGGPLGGGRIGGDFQDQVK